MVKNWKFLTHLSVMERCIETCFDDIRQSNFITSTINKFYYQNFAVLSCALLARLCAILTSISCSYWCIVKSTLHSNNNHFHIMQLGGQLVQNEKTLLYGSYERWPINAL